MSDWVFWVTIFLAGAIIGSFLNVVIHRGPALWGLVDDSDRRGNLATPRSYCPSCKQTLSPAELIPVASFFASGGRCRRCTAPISWRYPAVELAGAGAAMIAALLFGFSAQALLFALFAWTALALAVIDLETGYLPDALTLPLIGLGLIANIWGLFSPMIDSAIGAAAGYLVFLSISVVFRKLRNIEGLGLGDAKLLAAIGAWGGWIILAPTVFIAAVITLIGAGLASVSGRTVERETELPFGPALALSGVLLLAVTAAFSPDFLTGGRQ